MTTRDDSRAGAPPTTRRFGRVTFDDPHAWLEEDTPRTLAWQQALDQKAERHLRTLPEYDAALGHVRAVGLQHEVTAPRWAGGRWFRHYVPSGSNLAVIEVAPTPMGAGRRIVDLNAMSRGETLVLSWFVPSFEGGKIAFAWSGGDGAKTPGFRVLDVETGEIVEDGPPHPGTLFPAWLPGEKAFFVRAEGEGRRSVIYEHVLGLAPAKAPEPLDLPHPISWPVSEEGGRYVLAYSNHLEPRPVALLDTRRGRTWRPFLEDEDAMFRGVIADDRFIAITNDRAPRGRVVSLPLDDPKDRSRWKELVPATDRVLASLARVGRRLALVELDDTYARLHLLDFAGEQSAEVALPGRGVVSTRSGSSVPIAFMECVHGSDDTLSFVYSSLVESPAIAVVGKDEGRSVRVETAVARQDARVEDRVATSRDGERIPYRLVRPNAFTAVIPRPTVIFVSGGFNVALLPAWPLPRLAAWVRAGGNLVLAHVRGGGEFGPAWWRAGQRHHKENSFHDLFAVAESLVADRITTADQLGVHGQSNGGTLAAVAAVLRPDLFRAALPQLPLTDFFGLVRDPLSLMIACLEEGDPNDPEDSERLRRFSPYQNVRTGVAYPAVLIDCAVDDPRCPAWHGRKLAARIDEASASDRDVLLRVRTRSGQTPIGGMAQEQQEVENLAFLMHELGLVP